MATEQNIRAAHRLSPIADCKGFLIQTETSVYLSVESREVENLIPETDTSSGLSMPKVQLIRAEMPPELKTELFYFVVKDSN